MLSVVIPAHNEEGSIARTVRGLHADLTEAGIEHEILVVNDRSTDGTAALLVQLGYEIRQLRTLENTSPSGYGHTVRMGLQHYTGNCVAIVMADGSDDPGDLVRFHRELETGYDCVFGTRWSMGGRAIGYPFVKKLLNRTGNTVLRILFGMAYNDTSNAFKLYRRTVIDALQPLTSDHFELTLEMPLKAIVRGHTYSVLPNSWTGRRAGVSKLALRSMLGRYGRTMLAMLREKYLQKGHRG